MIKLTQSIASTVVRAISALLAIAIFSKTLSFDSFSYYVLGLFAAQIASIFIDAGINNEILRFARTENDKISNSRLARSTAIRLLLSSAILLGCVFYSLKIENTLDKLILIASFSSGILTSLNESYLTNMKSKNLFTKELWLTFFQAVFIFFAAYASYISTWLAPACIFIPRAFCFYLLAIKSNCIFTEIKNITPKKVIEHYVNLKHYSIDSIFSNVSTQIDNILIPILFGKTAFALYQPLAKLFSAGLTFSGSVGAFSIPLASTFERNFSKLIYLNGIFMVFGIAGSLAFYYLSGFFVKALFSDAFLIDQKTILLLSIILMFRFFCAGSGSYLTLIGKQRSRAMINATLTCSTIILCSIFSNSIEELLKLLTCFQGLQLITYLSAAVIYSMKERQNEAIPRTTLPQ